MRVKQVHLHAARGAQAIPAHPLNAQTQQPAFWRPAAPPEKGLPSLRRGRPFTLPGAKTRAVAFFIISGVKVKAAERALEAGSENVNGVTYGGRRGVKAFRLIFKKGTGLQVCSIRE